MSVATLALGCLTYLALSGQTATAPQQLTQADRDIAVRHLAETRQKFLDSIAGLSQEQWAFKPGPDRWSIAEVAEHIAISESTILELIMEKIMKAPAVPKDAAGPTDQKVIEMVTDRTEKAQAPEMLRPTNKWATREALVGDFNTARERTVAYVKTSTEDMRGHSAPHPVMKMLDGYQWILLLSGHTARHTAQIQEVKSAAGYPSR